MYHGIFSLRCLMPLKVEGGAKIATQNNESFLWYRYRTSNPKPYLSRLRRLSFQLGICLIIMAKPINSHVYSWVRIQAEPRSILWCNCCGVGEGMQDGLQHGASTTVGSGTPAAETTRAMALLPRALCGPDHPQWTGVVLIHVASLFINGSVT